MPALAPATGWARPLRAASLAKGCSYSSPGRTAERLEKVDAEIVAERGKAVAVVTDVTNEKDVIRLLSLAAESGTLELAVYNAGGNVASSLLQLKTSEFKSLWRQVALGGIPGRPRGCPPDASPIAMGP